MNFKLLFLWLLYFVQGLPHGLQSSLLPIYLRSSGLSLTRISLTKALYFPWILKVLWAPLVDQVGTKKRWLMGSMLGLALVCLASSALSPDSHFPMVIMVLLAMNFLASVQDIAVDGVAVQLLQRQEEVGYGNMVQVVGYKMGSVLAGGGLLAVMDVVGWSAIFLVLSCMYCAVVLYIVRTPFLNKYQMNPSDEKRCPAGGLNPWNVWKELMTVPGTLWTVIYVLIYKLGEQGAVTMFPLFLLDHHMSARELGIWNGMVAMGFSVCGSSAAGILIARHSIGYLMRSAFMLRMYSMAFQTILLLLYSQASLMKGAAILSLCIQHFLGGLITTLTFTTMMNCTQKAEESIQATHYSFLATLEVLGKLTFSALAGCVVDWLGFPVSFLIFLLLSAAATLHVCKATEGGQLKHQTS
ncbi:major facilitator superfamily domain-containing protein 3 [Brienomyrus brachyistius]|uniref:major facilitator superfamily domain-containing protein 3 n=1 Tax=Brienomyrus brachyistius TaxID=42636 RepID=UPI0020B4141A|nr:major facilitator superfamily domain-containing protein 3 [Brienomyrus brachyistius]XP_048835667.1 major facilitator superfamily domain-containing protein 3 [Brienomyrus brachyistius]